MNNCKRKHFSSITMTKRTQKTASLLSDEKYLTALKRQKETVEKFQAGLSEFTESTVLLSLSLVYFDTLGRLTTPVNGSELSKT